MRKRRSADEWRQLIEQQADSGLSGLAFCRQHGLLAKTFYHQRKLLSDRELVPTVHPFIKVDSGPVQQEATQPEAILQYRDSRLQLPAGTDPGWLARLMSSLQ
jgi:putative transposase